MGVDLTTMTRGVSSFSDDRQRVLDAADIVQIVGECVSLKPKGREFVGLCPFHDDHSPSMFVAPHKQIFKCFSCGAGGNSIDFVMRYHRIEFREALQMLAERAGIELQPTRVSKDATSSSNDAGVSGADIVEAHRVALRFYRTILAHESHGQTGREQFVSRGFGDDIIERFELGVAPDRWDGLATYLDAKNIPLRPYLAAGLVQARKSGDGHIDRFRNRLIFPIHDATGRPIAFGARKIDPDDEPKYLNSPEHPRFNKSATLYGLHLASRAIQRANEALLVEGYTDVIALHAAGVENAVATLGTSLTRDHARILKRLCDRVTLVFDGDAAGQKAADRAVEIFFQGGVDVRVAVLPGGQDPADLAASDAGVEQFRSIVSGAPDAIEYLYRAFSAQWRDASGSVSQRERLVESFAERLVDLGFRRMGPVRRALILDRLTRLLGVSVQAIEKAFAGGGRRRPARESAPAPDHAAERTVAPSPRVQAERGLVGCLIHTPHLLEHLDHDGRPLRVSVKPELLRDDAARQAFEALLEASDEEREPSRLGARFNDPAMSEFITDLYWSAQRMTDGEDAQLQELCMAYFDALRRHEAATASLTRAAEADSNDQDRLEAVVQAARARGGNRRALTKARAALATPDQETHVNRGRVGEPS
ncbi:MAG: DNA primase [Phycisphaerales bacterium]